MSTDLERFRDHCHRMATSTPTTRVRASWGAGRAEQVMPVGSMPDDERALWRRLAAETQAYLDGAAVDQVPDDPRDTMEPLL